MGRSAARPAPVRQMDLFRERKALGEDPFGAERCYTTEKIKQGNCAHTFSASELDEWPGFILFGFLDHSWIHGTSRQSERALQRANDPLADDRLATQMASSHSRCLHHDGVAVRPWSWQSMGRCQKDGECKITRPPPLADICGFSDHPRTEAALSTFWFTRATSKH